MEILIVEQSTTLLAKYSSQMHDVALHAAATCAQAVSIADSKQIQLAFIGACGNQVTTVIEILKALRSLESAPDVILLAERSSEELAIAALRCGAWDYIRGPVSGTDVANGLNRWIAAHSKPPKAHTANFNRIVGISPAMVKLRDHLEHVAASECNVLITGETGTGKELVADLIHLQGPRKANPFVCINCAAIPDALLESELFGYDRGAFTGASSTRDGKMLLANGGSIFFDEVGEMPLYSQAKILRAIESRVIQRVGGRRDIPIDIRIIAATNQDVERLSDNNLFRRDLLFRLNVLRVHLPALRERSEDIPPLVDHYIRLFNQKSKRGYKVFTKEAMQAMRSYSWPGNIRELRNVIEALFITCNSCEIEPSDLPSSIQSKPTPVNRMTRSPNREDLIQALNLSGWNISKAAEELKWSRMTVYRKMNLFGIEQPLRRERAG